MILWHNNIVVNLMKTESIKRQSGNLKLYLSAKVYHNRFAVLWVQFAQEGNMNQAIEQKRDFVFDDGIDSL